MPKDYKLEKRKYVIGGAAIFIVLVYLVRLLDLQIMTDEYKKYADNNAFLNIRRAEPSTTGTASCWCSISRRMTSLSCRARSRGWIRPTSAKR